MLNKLVLRVFLSLSIAFSCAGTANATLISQDILFNSIYDNEDTFVVIGNVTLETDTMDDWGWVEGTWESFSFYGFDVDPFDAAELDYFYAIFDVSNVMRGIESLDFGVRVLSDLVFAGYIDVYAPVDSVTFSLFNNADANLWDAGALAFGRATAVPVPATLVLFLMGMMGLVVRHKNS